MLGDDIAAVLPGLRAQAESMMVDGCAISRQRLDENGKPVQVMDPVTLELTFVWDEVHSGPCRIQRRDISAMPESVVGDFEYGVSPMEVQLPFSVTAAKRGDRVMVTAAVFDPRLEGAVATVLAVPDKTHATKRALLCRVVTE